MAATHPANDAADDGDPLPPRYTPSSAASTPRSHRRDRELPRELLYVKKYVELDDFSRMDVRRLDELSDDDKKKRFGSSVVPIFVPLARGESIRQYEDRFMEWLRREKRMTLRDVETHRDPTLEREYWIQFAELNGKGAERFSPGERSTKRERSAERGASVETETKRAKRTEERHRGDERHHAETAKTTEKDACRVRRPAADAPIAEFVAAHVTCGCRRCLMKAVSRMAARVSELESTIDRKCRCKPNGKTSTTPSGVADSSREDDRASNASDRASGTAAMTKVVLSRPTTEELIAHSPITATATKPPGESSDDPVEQQLAREYDAINKRIQVNEKTFEVSSARLASTTIMDIEETARLHDEKEELHALIQRDIEKRTAALAALVVYMWRHRQSDLDKMVRDAAASNVPHVQRVGHTKCSKLAADLVEKREYAGKIRKQLDAAAAGDASASKRLVMLQRLGEMLTKAEAEIRDLLAQRRRELATLVHFDERVRALVRAQLPPP